MTHDGKEVKAGDIVYVFSSVGKIEKTVVKPTVQVTDYYLFGDIPVTNSFSTREAAEIYKRKYRK